MYRATYIFSCFLACFCWQTLQTRAQVTEKITLEIPATSNVYYHTYKVSKDMVPGGIGVEPIVVDVSGAKMISFENTSGIVNFYASKDSCKDCSADGCEGYTNISGIASKELSGIAHTGKKGFLVGVFISTTTFPETLPSAINFKQTENYTTWGPELDLVFFIGDGLTNNGETQHILVPDDADKLYLGFADAFVGSPCRYDDNTGSIHTTIVLHKTSAKSAPLKKQVKN